MNSNFTALFPPSIKRPTKAYSNGIIVPVGNARFCFLTGQLAQDDEGNVVSPGNAHDQTTYIFGRISAILAEAGMTLDDVVKVQIFVTNIADMPSVSKIRNEVFANSRPVSTFLEVSRFVKEGCCVEIEVLAIDYKID